MYKIVSHESIKELEIDSIKKYNYSNDILMERAGIYCADFIEKIIEEKNVYIFCGQYNNGGDGLVIARELINRNHQNIKIILIGESKTDLNRENFKRAKSINLDIEKFKDTISIKKNSVIVDALLSVGINSELKGPYKKAVEIINKSKSTIISIDLPSGIFETRINEIAVNATYTLNIGPRKKSFWTPENRINCGEIIFLNNIFPKIIEEKVASKFFLVNEEYINSLKFPITKNYYKNKKGNCAVFCGSKNYPGAAILSCRSLLKTGAGLVTLFTNSSIAKEVMSESPEIILKDHTNNVNELKNYNSILIGCGWSTDDEKVELIKNIKKIKTPVVFDADALNIIAKYELQKSLPELSIITPHPKEFEKLHNRDYSKNFIDDLCEYANKNNTIVIYKTFFTVIATEKKEAFIIDNPNSAIATAGSGDVLASTIASLLTIGVDKYNAAILGVYFHNLAGNNLSKKFGWITAEKLIEEISLLSYNKFNGE